MLHKTRISSYVCHRLLQSKFISGAVLQNRVHIEVTGKDAKKYLQGICTNDVERYIL